MNKVVGERTLKTYTKPMQMSYPTFWMGRLRKKLYQFISCSCGCGNSFSWWTFQLEMKFPWNAFNPTVWIAAGNNIQLRDLISTYLHQNWITKLMLGYRYRILIGNVCSIFDHIDGSPTFDAYLQDYDSFWIFQIDAASQQQQQNWVYSYHMHWGIGNHLLCKCIESWNWMERIWWRLSTYHLVWMLSSIFFCKTSTQMDSNLSLLLDYGILLSD